MELTTKGNIRETGSTNAIFRGDYFNGRAENRYREKSNSIIFEST